MKKVTKDITAFQYFYPYTVALVGARVEDRVNFMSCAWHTALSFHPPLFGVLIAKKRYTHEIVTQAGEFSANFLAADQILLSARMGRISGRDQDKVREFEVNLNPGVVIASPVLEEAYAAFECKLQEVRTYGDHDLFVGNVLAVHEETGSFTPEGVLDPHEVKPLLYLGSDFYMTVDADSKQHKLPF